MVCWVQQAGGCCGGVRICGPLPVAGHGGGPERAADLARGGGAHDAVVAVSVVGAGPAEFVPGEFGGLGVVRGDLLWGGGGGQRPEFQQRFGGGGAVQVAVGDDGAVVGAAGSAVVRVQVLDELGAGGAERDGPGAGVAVGVAGVGEDVAEADAVFGHAGDGDEGAGRVGVQLVRVIREVSSGMAGPRSSRVMVPTEW